MQAAVTVCLTILKFKLKYKEYCPYMFTQVHCLEIVCLPYPCVFFPLSVRRPVCPMCFYPTPVFPSPPVVLPKDQNSGHTHTWRFQLFSCDSSSRTGFVR